MMLMFGEYFRKHLRGDKCQDVVTHHISKTNKLPQYCTPQDIVQIVTLAQEHHHVQRIVEECRATGKGQKDHRANVCSTDCLAGADAPAQPIFTPSWGYS